LSRVSVSNIDHFQQRPFAKISLLSITISMGKKNPNCEVGICILQNALAYA